MGSRHAIVSLPVAASSPTRLLHSTVRRGQLLLAPAKKSGGGKGDSDSSDSGKGGKGGKGGGGGDVDVAKIEKEAKVDADERMKKTLTALGESFNTIRTGRANASILDKIMVDQSGSQVSLKKLATIMVPDASTLVINPFDPSALKAIEKALQESDLGINPSNDGERIRLNIPPLTQDRRKELSKSVAKFAEDGKVALRNVRQDVMKKINKVEGFSKDSKKDLEDAIQKLTDASVKKIDEMAKAKTDEVMKL